MDKFAIPKENVLYLIIGLAVIILGCLFLMGGGADSPEVFNYALFSFSRMYVAPFQLLENVRGSPADSRGLRHRAGRPAPPQAHNPVQKP